MRLRRFHRTVTKVRSRSGAAAKIYFFSEISSKIWPNGMTRVIEFQFFLNLEIWPKFEGDWDDFFTESPKIRSCLVRQQILFSAQNFFENVAKWCNQPHMNFIFSQTWDLTKFWMRLRRFHDRVTKVRSLLVQQQKFTFSQKFLRKWWPNGVTRVIEFQFFSQTLRFDRNWRRLRRFHHRVTKNQVMFSAAANFYFPLKMSSKMWPNGVTSLIEFSFFLKLEIWPNSKAIEEISWQSHQSYVPFSAAAKITICRKCLRKSGQMV